MMLYKYQCDRFKLPCTAFKSLISPILFLSDWSNSDLVWLVEKLQYKSISSNIVYLNMGLQCV